MRVAIAIGLTVVVVGVIPLPARSNDNGDAVVAGVAAALIGGVLCWTGTVAAAGLTDVGEYARSGWLLGIGGGYALPMSEDDLESDLEDVIGPVSFDLDESWGIQGHAGYRCHPRISAEVEAEWLDAFAGDAEQAGETAEIDIEPLVVTTNLKAHLLTGRYQPYLLFGVGVMDVDVEVDDPTSPSESFDNENSITMRFGGGVDLYATRNIVVNVGADYVLPGGDNQDLDYVSIGGGLEYRF